MSLINAASLLTLLTNTDDDQVWKLCSDNLQPLLRCAPTHFGYNVSYGDSVFSISFYGSQAYFNLWIKAMV